jgi:hypothetical protein
MATTSEASQLQKAGYVMRVTGITVGLLAVLGFSACGVGVDDPTGQQAAYGTSGQALLGPDGTPVTDPATPGSDVPVAGGGTQSPVNPGISALPTDPVPWHNPGAMVDPLTAAAAAAAVVK